MRNILWSEWRSMAALLANEAAIRHPFLDVSNKTPGEIRIATHSVSGSIEIQAHTHGTGMAVVFKVTSSACASGGTSVLMDHARNAREVAECAAWIEARVDGAVVWFKECPCDYCGARGVSMGGPCKNCNGVGKRTDKPAENSDA